MHQTSWPVKEDFLEHVVDAHFRLIPPEPCERRIVLSLVDYEARSDIVLSPDEAAFLVVESDQALAEPMRYLGAIGANRATRALAGLFYRNFTQFIDGDDASVRAARPPALLDA